MRCGWVLPRTRIRAVAGGTLSRRRACMSPEETAGALRTGGVVSEGVCTLLAGPGVQSPFQTRSAVYKAGLCALGGVLRRGFVQCPKSGRGLCTLEASFRRGFVHCPRELVYKVPSKQGRQCTKSGRTIEGRHFTGADSRKVQKSPFYQKGVARWLKRILRSEGTASTGEGPWD